MSKELHDKFDALQRETAIKFQRLAWRTDNRFYRLIRELRNEQR